MAKVAGIFTKGMGEGKVAMQLVDLETRAVLSHYTYQVATATTLGNGFAKWTALGRMNAAALRLGYRIVTKEQAEVMGLA